MSSNWIEILKDIDDESINWDILEWAEVRDLWDEHYEILARYSVVDDVLRQCDSAEVFTETYDFNFPGRSGILYTVETNDPDGLKLEIRHQIEQLINPPRQSTFAPIDPVKVHGIEHIIDFLMAEAATVRNLRAPPGYQVLAEGTARVLESAAQELLNGHWDNARISSHLIALVDKVATPGTKSSLAKIIKNLQ